MTQVIRYPSLLLTLLQAIVWLHFLLLRNKKTIPPNFQSVYFIFLQAFTHWLLKVPEASATHFFKALQAFANAVLKVLPASTHYPVLLLLHRFHSWS